MRFFKYTFLICYFLGAGLVTANETQFELTEPEKAWIQANPEIAIGNEINWPPFDFTRNEEATGYSIELIRLITQKVGLTPKFINGVQWDELLKLFKKGEIDVLPAVYRSNERLKFMVFTKPYVSNSSVSRRSQQQ